MKSEEYDIKFSHVFGEDLDSKERITENWKGNSPFNIIGDSISDKLRTNNWYFDCGMNDIFVQGNEMLHQLFLKYNIPHEYHVRIGSHNWEIWRDGIINGIKFTVLKLGKL